MATEKRLIDANALMKANMYGNTAPVTHRTYAEMLIQKAPTVDAVEVVRCKDCKRRIEKRWCYSLHTYNGEPVGVADDFFCAYGKRKSDG